jgi:hypothetical protein
MRRLLLTLALIAVAPVAARADITVQIDNAKLRLPMPDGYCALDTDRAREASLFDFEAETLQGRSWLMAMAADCGELEGFRIAHHPVTHTLTFEVPLQDGKPMHRPDAERAAYLAELSKAIAKTSTGEVASFNNKWWKNFGITVNVKSFGAAGRDDSGLYLRNVRVAEAEKKLTIASISAVTVASNLVLAANFYQQSADEHGLAMLRELAHLEAKALIDANQPPPPPAADDSSITDSVVPGAVAADMLDAQALADPLGQMAIRFGRQGTIALITALSVMAFSFLLLLVTRPAAPSPYRAGERERYRRRA